MITLRPMTIIDLEQFKKWIYTPHVAKWYENPLNWIEEIENKNGQFSCIHHFIIEKDGTDIGFCQYYYCKDINEEWDIYTTMDGTYSIDYFIGEKDCLHQGYGKEMVHILIQKIKEHSDAKRIVLQPDKENNNSRKLLLSCGFQYDTERDFFVLPLN